MTGSVKAVSTHLEAKCRTLLPKYWVCLQWQSMAFFDKFAVLSPKKKWIAHLTWIVHINICCASIVLCHRFMYICLLASPATNIWNMIINYFPVWNHRDLLPVRQTHMMYGHPEVARVTTLHVWYKVDNNSKFTSSHILRLPHFVTYAAPLSNMD